MKERPVMCFEVRFVGFIHWYLKVDKRKNTSLVHITSNQMSNPGTALTPNRLGYFPKYGFLTSPANSKNANSKDQVQSVFPRTCQILAKTPKTHNRYN